MSPLKSLNRRQFIGAIGAGVAVTGCSTDSSLPGLLPPGAEALPPELTSPAIGPPEGGTSPAIEESEILGGQPLYPGLDTKTILLSRITFGPKATDVAEINSLGYSAYLEKQLNPATINDSQMASRLAPLTTLSASATALSGMESTLVINELASAAILRAVHSKRQLFERMVEFWTDHFNIYHFLGSAAFYKTIDDREVIRPFALGRFKDLLRASAKSPSMLMYLNNHQNIAGHPNENYAREVMELHTMGVDAGYTQQDVRELARAMTGWRIATSGAGQHTFQFRPDLHDNGAKQIMGLSLPAGGGITDGEKALDHLAGLATTARHIAHKLVTFFVSETPSPALVDQTALMFRVTGGDIKAALRVVLSDAAMRQATAKLKRPLHLYTDIARRSGTNVTASSFLPTLPSAMGHRPFAWSSPDGYPQRSAYWATGLLSRWNVVSHLLNGNVEGFPLSPVTLAESNGAITADQVVTLWNQLFFGGRMSTTDRQALLNYIQQAPQDPWRRNSESLALALSLPAFQFH